MELTDEQFTKYDADYNKKFVAELLEHGGGGFRTLTHRRTATRYALERLVASLEPAQKPLSDRVVSTIDYPHLDIYRGVKGTITQIGDENDALVKFDGVDGNFWMDFSGEIRRITE
jgi:hypothetical protein